MWRCWKREARPTSKEADPWRLGFCHRAHCDDATWGQIDRPIYNNNNIPWCQRETHTLDNRKILSAPLASSISIQTIVADIPVAVVYYVWLFIKEFSSSIFWLFSRRFFNLFVLCCVTYGSTFYSSFHYISMHLYYIYIYLADWLAFIDLYLVFPAIQPLDNIRIIRWNRKEKYQST